MATCPARSGSMSRPHPEQGYRACLGLMRLGRVSEGLPLLEEGVSLTEGLGVKAYLALWTVHLGEGLLAAGQVDRALAVTRQALELARTHKEEGHQAWARRLLGDIHARLAPADLGQAEACYREAAALATRLEMAPLLAQCQLSLAGC